MISLAGRHVLRCLPLLAGLLLIASGCGPKLGELHGKVTYQGKDVTVGTVSLRSDDGQTANGVINKDGTYVIEKVPVGKTMKVAVGTPRAEGKNERTGNSAPPAPKGGDKVPPGVPPEAMSSRDAAHGKGYTNLVVPEKFGDYDKSGLSVETKGGKQEFDIPLK